MIGAIGRLLLVAVAASLGLVAGWVAGSVRHVRPEPENYPTLVERHPLPHRVPEHAGGVSFRFAMAHDVLVERFPKHGPAFYEERNRLTRLELARLMPGDPAWFAASDDLAAGLERLGRSDEAVGIMRDKLNRQRERGLSGRDLYTSFANLGTFLIHGSFRQSLAGEPEARARFREGVGFIRQSVEVNPQAHFGRERWQAAIAEFLLAAMDDPKLLNAFDCIGDGLDLSIEHMIGPTGGRSYSHFGQSYTPDFADQESNREVPAFFRAGADLDDPSRWKELAPIRRSITQVGAWPPWENVPVPSNRKPAPFDEPSLGIIGMWRQGGGANPHFALALGEIMLRVGQRYIAWEAFERASMLADRFWPVDAERQALRDHCKARQGDIEATIKASALEHRPPRIYDTGADLRTRFNAELAFGEAYQKAYQEYEASKVAGGASIDDEHFDDAFRNSRGPIASNPGPEEWYVGVPRSKMATHGQRRARDWGILGAGLAAMASALLVRWRSGR